MSAGMALPTSTVHVRLLDEGVDVFRPVRALALGDDRFVILAQAIPADEMWEFLPGAVVETTIRTTSEGVSRIAVAAAALVSS